MSKLFTRLVASFLIFCLIADPAFAIQTFQHSLINNLNTSLLEGHFKEEALAVRARWSLHVLGDYLDNLGNLFDATRIHANWGLRPQLAEGISDIPEYESHLRNPLSNWFFSKFRPGSTGGGNIDERRQFGSDLMLFGAGLQRAQTLFTDYQRRRTPEVRREFLETIDNLVVIADRMLPVIARLGPARLGLNLQIAYLVAHTPNRPFTNDEQVEIDAEVRYLFGYFVKDATEENIRDFVAQIRPMSLRTFAETSLDLVDQNVGAMAGDGGSGNFFSQFLQILPSFGVHLGGLGEGGINQGGQIFVASGMDGAMTAAVTAHEISHIFSSIFLPTNLADFQGSSRQQERYSDILLGLALSRRARLRMLDELQHYGLEDAESFRNFRQIYDEARRLAQTGGDASERWKTLERNIRNRLPARMSAEPLPERLVSAARAGELQGLGEFFAASSGQNSNSETVFQFAYQLLRDIWRGSARASYVNRVKGAVENLREQLNPNERKGVERQFRQIWEDFSAAYRSAQGHFRALARSRDARDRTAFIESTERLTEIARPLRALIQQYGDSFIEPRLRSTAHAMLQSPGGPFTSEELTAIRDDVGILLDTWQPTINPIERERIITNIQPIGMKLFAEASVAMAQQGAMISGAGAEGLYSAENAFASLVEFMTMGRGIHGLNVQRTNSPTGIRTQSGLTAVSAGMNPSMTGAIAAHEASHEILSAMVPVTATQMIRNAVPEEVPEAVITLSIIRRGDINELRRIQLFGLSLPFYADYIAPYEMALSVSAEINDPIARAQRLGQRLRALVPRETNTIPPFMWGAALAAEAQIVSGIVAREHGREDSTASMRLAYRFLYHFARATGSHGERSREAEARLRLEATGLLALPIAPVIDPAENAQNVHPHGLTIVAGIWATLGAIGWIFLPTLAAFVVSAMAILAVSKHLKSAYSQWLTKLPFPQYIKEWLGETDVFPYAGRIDRDSIAIIVSKWNLDHPGEGRIDNFIFDNSVSLMQVSGNELRVNPVQFTSMSERDVIDLLRYHEGVHLNRWAQLPNFNAPHTRVERSAAAIIRILNEIPAYGWYGLLSPILLLRSVFHVIADPLRRFIADNLISIISAFSFSTLLRPNFMPTSHYGQSAIYQRLTTPMHNGDLETARSIHESIHHLYAERDREPLFETYRSNAIFDHARWPTTTQAFGRVFRRNENLRPSLGSRNSQLFPSQIGVIMMQYHGWFNEFGDHSEYAAEPSNSLRLALVADDNGESRNGFVSGKLVYADRPGQPMAVANLWIQRSIIEAPRHNVLTRNGAKQENLNRVAVTAVAKDGSRLYYVDEATGICFSGCVDVHTTNLQRTTGIAHEIVEDFLSMRARRDEYEAIGLALELLALVNVDIRDNVKRMVWEQLGSNATSRVREALNRPSSQLSEPAIQRRNNRDVLVEKINRFIEDHPEEAVRYFQLPLDPADLQTSLPYRILPRGWIWIKHQLGVPAQTSDMLKVILEDHLQGEIDPTRYNILSLSVLDLIMIAAKDSVLRHNDTTYSHYSMIQDLLRRWTRPITSDELAAVVTPHWDFPVSEDFFNQIRNRSVYAQFERAPFMSGTMGGINRLLESRIGIDEPHIISRYSDTIETGWGNVQRLAIPNDMHDHYTAALRRLADLAPGFLSEGSASSSELNSQIASSALSRNMDAALNRLQSPGFRASQLAAEYFYNRPAFFSGIFTAIKQWISRRGRNFPFAGFLLARAA